MIDEHAPRLVVCVGHHRHRRRFRRQFPQNTGTHGHMRMGGCHRRPRPRCRHGDVRHPCRAKGRDRYLGRERAACGSSAGARSFQIPEVCVALCKEGAPPCVRRMLSSIPTRIVFVTGGGSGAMPADNTTFLGAADWYQTSSGMRQQPACQFVVKEIYTPFTAAAVSHEIRKELANSLLEVSIRSFCLPFRPYGSNRDDSGSSAYSSLI